eukprot:scaffold78782_cov57-Phaeocystis_antarctica.AAC.2
MAHAADLVARVHDVLPQHMRAILLVIRGGEGVVHVRQVGLEPPQKVVEETDEQVAAVLGRVTILLALSHEAEEEHDEAVGGEATRVHVVEVEVAQEGLEDDDEGRELRQGLEVGEHEVARHESRVLRRGRDGDVHGDADLGGELEDGDARAQHERLPRDPRQLCEVGVQLLERLAHLARRHGHAHEDDVHVGARQVEAGGARAVHLNGGARPPLGDHLQQAGLDSLHLCVTRLARGQVGVGEGDDLVVQLGELELRHHRRLHLHLTRRGRRALRPPSGSPLAPPVHAARVPRRHRGRQRGPHLPATAAAAAHTRLAHGAGLAA